jgi:hypothetical protein
VAVGTSDSLSRRGRTAPAGRIAAGGDDGGPIGRLSARERFHWLVAPRSTVLQVSPVHSGLCESPEAELAQLFESMVRLPRAGTGPAR